MAISSTISVDNSAATATTSIYVGGSTLIESITYTNSSQSLVCATHASTTLSAVDTISMLKLYFILLVHIHQELLHYLQETLQQH